MRWPLLEEKDAQEQPSFSEIISIAANASRVRSTMPRGVA